MNQGKKPIKIRFEYEKAKNLQLQYVHGVWGGITPQGEIELNFYSESDKFPEFSEQIVSPDGAIGQEILPEPNEKTVVRNVHSKLLMNYFTAKALLDWLEEKVEMLEDEQEDAASFYASNDEGFKQ